MKVKTYLRIARTRKGKVLTAASPTKNDAPIFDSQRRPLPTIAFALDFDLPDNAFKQAERVLATIAIEQGAFDIPANVAYSYTGENNDEPQA